MARRNNKSQNTLEDRVAVRFLIKKSKRIRNITLADRLVPEEETKGKDKPAAKKESKEKKLRPMTPESLLYLGLSHRRDKTTDELKPETTQDDLFAKPKVFRCDICLKTFLHRIPFRRHMLQHIKNMRWCPKCGLGFKAITHMRRHRIECKGTICKGF